MSVKQENILYSKNVENDIYLSTICKIKRQVNNVREIIENLLRGCFLICGKNSGISYIIFVYYKA